MYVLTGLYVTRGNDRIPELNYMINAVCFLHSHTFGGYYCTTPDQQNMNKMHGFRIISDGVETLIVVLRNASIFCCSLA